MNNKSQVIENMSWRDYFALDAVNATFLTTFSLRTPATAKWQAENPRKDTPAFLLGRALHSLVLEPDTHDQRFATAPADMDRRTKAGKATWVDLVATGKDILKADDDAKVRAMAARLVAHEELAARLHRGRTELTLLWEMDGVRCKARIDLLADSMIFCIKSTRQFNEHAFTNDCFRYGYDLKAAWYLWAAEQCDLGPDLLWVWAMIESSDSFEPAMYTASPAWMESAKRNIRDIWSLYLECARTGVWPGHHTGVRTLHAPDWKIEERLIEDEPGF